MKISQIKPIGTDDDGVCVEDTTWMYRTAETADRIYYYKAHRDKNVTEIYSYEPEYKSHTIQTYLPMNPKSPEESVVKFWMLVALK